MFRKLDAMRRRPIGQGSESAEIIQISRLVHMEWFSIQGTSKRLFPGCVKLGEKVAFCLPTAGRRTQFFHPAFSQPGKSLLEVPCTFWEMPCNTTICEVSFGFSFSISFDLYHYVPPLCCFSMCIIYVQW